MSADNSPGVFKSHYLSSQQRRGRRKRREEEKKEAGQSRELRKNVRCSRRIRRRCNGRDRFNPVVSSHFHTLICNMVRMYPPQISGILSTYRVGTTYILYTYRI